MGRRLIALVVMVLALSAGVEARAGYRNELRRATKSGRMYSVTTWDAKLMWHATFLGDRFRRAFEKKHVKIEHLGPLQAARFVSEQEYRHAEGWDFFVGFYTKSEYKKFSSEPDSFWKIFITTETGEAVHPRAIEMIPISPYEEIMYPYLTRWSKAYRVTFPKVGLGKKFSLTLQSVVGESTLKWKNE